MSFLTRPAAYWVSELIRRTAPPFHSRADALAGKVLPWTNRITVLTDTIALHYRRDDASLSPALVLADGSKWVPDGRASPLHYGFAVGGSASANAAAFLAALAGSPIGSTLYLPRGTYTTNQIDWSRSISLDADPDAVLRLANGADSHVINANNAGIGFKIRGLTIDGNRANQTAFETSQIVLNVRECSNVTIDSVTVFDGAYDGIRIWSSPDSKVTGCTVTNCAGPGIRPFTAARCTVSGNTCVGNGTDGIDVDAFSTGNIVTNNVCRNNARTGIFIEEASKRIIVTGNLCEGNAIGINVNDQDVSGLTSIVLAHNVCRNNNGTGIRVSANTAGKDVRSISIIGNICEDNSVVEATNGILLRAAVDGTVQNVLVSGNRSFGHQGYGMTIQTSRVSQVTLSGNDFSGNTLGAISGREFAVLGFETDFPVVAGPGVQSSATDAGAGKLLTVGAFGIGSTRAPSIPGGDFTAEFVSGDYRVSSAYATHGSGPDTQTFEAHVRVGRGFDGRTWFAYSRASESSPRVWHGYRTGATGAVTWTEQNLAPAGTSIVAGGRAFTPTLLIGGVEISTQGGAYAEQTGRFHTVAPGIMWLAGTVTLSAKGSGAGNVRIAIPATATDGMAIPQFALVTAVTVNLASIATTPDQAMASTGGSGSRNINLSKRTGSTTANITEADLNDTTTISFAVMAPFAV